MASEKAIVPTNGKMIRVSTAFWKLFSKLATIRVSGVNKESPKDLCVYCSKFDFGESLFSSESLDIYKRAFARGVPKYTMYGSCPLCKLFEGNELYTKCYRYEHAAVIHGNCPSGRVVFFLVNDIGTALAFVHKLPAEDSLPCAISLDIRRANMCLASKWVRLCYEKHEGTCGEKLEQFVPGLKVIDCISREICVATQGNPYVALSYVWGPPSSVSHNLTGKVPQTFPRTIEDAMVVAKRLGIPHLWVDRYCIDQNSQKEKHIMISNMNNIYSGAAVTIIAAVGSDPQYGLPGISTTARYGTSIDTFSHGSLLSWKRHGDSDIDQSHWGARGWTYQEMLLSRRRLVFTDSEMLFQCCSSQFQERLNITAPSDPIPNIGNVAFPDIDGVNYDSTKLHTRAFAMKNAFPMNGIGESAEEIYSRIEEYTSRKLSYPGDILNAFNGIFSAYDRSMQEYESHFWGVPILRKHSEFKLHQWTQSYIAGLAWYVPKHCDRRPGLWPSWSWTTVMGKGVRCLGYLHGTELKLHKAMTCTFTHNTGAKESISDFVQRKRDCTEYDQCVDVTTWVLQGCEIMMYRGTGQFHRRGDVVPLLVHPSFSTEMSYYHPPTIRLDVDLSEEQLSAAYVALYLLATKEETILLVSQEVDDRCVRRIGLATISHGPRVCEDSRKTGELTWLPGVEHRKSFNEWKWKTVRIT
jgi:hypothetical protein